MIINKNSWHYKFIKESWVGSEIYKPDPVSLCPYMRRLAYVFLVSVICYSFFVFIPFVVVNTIGYGIMGFIYGFSVASGAIEFSLIIAFAATFGGLVIGVIELTRRLYRKAKGKVTEKQDGIFIEYAKSVHNKVCPNIDYKE
jgi:hypothetical protein